MRTVCNLCKKQDSERTGPVFSSSSVIRHLSCGGAFLSAQRHKAASQFRFLLAALRRFSAVPCREGRPICACATRFLAALHFSPTSALLFCSGVSLLSSFPFRRAFPFRVCPSDFPLFASAGPARFLCRPAFPAFVHVRPEKCRPILPAPGMPFTLGFFRRIV